MAFGGVQTPRTLLCINLSHVAEFRAEQGGRGLRPVEAAAIATKMGCKSIAVYLREDRHYLHDSDVIAIRESMPINGKFYLEIPRDDEMIRAAVAIRPDRITIIPRREEEMTANGGFDVRKNLAAVRNAVRLFGDQGIPVCLPVEPDIDAISLAKESGADVIQIHTERYSKAVEKIDIANEIDKIYRAAEHAADIRIKINAGRGLDYDNVAPLFNAKELLELNIGRAILSRAASVGLPKAIQDMMDLLD